MKPGRPDAQPPRKDYPTPFQKKALWSAITGAAMLSVGVMSVYVIGVIARVLQFLQPVLVPIAFAGILAYLLDPIVRRLVVRGVPRFRAMMWVWLSFHLILLMLFISVAIPTVSNGSRFISSNQDRWVESVGGFFSKTLQGIDDIAVRFSGGVSPSDEEEAATIPPADEAGSRTASDLEITAPVAEEVPKGTTADLAAEARADAAKRRKELAEKQSKERIKVWLSEHGEEISQRTMSFIDSSLQGFFGFFGYLVGFILIPLYLYYFLKESDAIKRDWSKYVPLRASRFKAEVISVLDEINRYLVAFFRGQMLVSLIDGLLVGISLTIIGLPYALLIGVFVAILGLIPYVGNLVCWFAALMISIAHFGRTDEAGHLVNTFAGMDNVWAYPLLVTVLFVFVQKFNSLVTAPRIVGDAVGLHPLTVIFSVLFWSLLIGGMLGALLAVPLTASVKVLFRRYLWERRVQPRMQELET